MKDFEELFFKELMSRVKAYNNISKEDYEKLNHSLEEFFERRRKDFEGRRGNRRLKAD